jgi:hypothetical protein
MFEMATRLGVHIACRAGPGGEGGMCGGGYGAGCGANWGKAGGLQPGCGG